MANEQLSEDLIVGPSGLPLPTRKTRKRLVIAVLVFCASVIGSIITWGDPSNSLHTSAMAWSFATLVGTFFAYVFGAVVDNWSVINKSK